VSTTTEARNPPDVESDSSETTYTHEESLKKRKRMDSDDSGEKVMITNNNSGRSKKKTKKSELVQKFCARELKDGLETIYTSIFPRDTVIFYFFNYYIPNSSILVLFHYLLFLENVRHLPYLSYMLRTDMHNMCY